jgi:hypothetical protein
MRIGCRRQSTHIGPEHHCLTQGQLLANSEADKGVDPVHISAAGNRAVARLHDTIEVQGACQVEFQGQLLVPVSGPRQQIDGGCSSPRKLAPANGGRASSRKNG